MIFIPGNVPSKKNNRWSHNGKIFNSDDYKIYIKNTQWLWAKARSQWQKEIQGKELPLCVGLHFVRKTRHAFDYINPSETIQDLMQKYQWIFTDDCHNIITFPFRIDGHYFSHDPQKPGVYIKVFHHLPELNLHLDSKLLAYDPSN